MSWQGVVEATQGVVLGGSPRVTSCRFEKREHAEAWVEVIVEGNLGSRRDVKGWVEERKGDPEILASEIDGKEKS